jgi:hypothetical protein
MDDAFDGQSYERCGVIGVFDHDIGGETVLLPFDLGAHGVCRVDGVGVAGKTEADTGSGVTIVHAGRIVAFGTQLNGRDILQLDQGAIGLALEDDRFKFFPGLQAAASRHRGIQLLAWALRQRAELARGDLSVLILDCGGDVADDQLVFCQLVRIHPYAHGIAGTEDLRIANAGDAAQRIVERIVDEVGEIVCRLLVVRRDEGRNHEETRCGFRDSDAGILHHLRQSRLDKLQIVLHLHLRDIGIGRIGEGERDRRLSGRGRVGRDVVEIVDAGHALLDDLGDRVLDRLGIRAGIVCGDPHRGRRDLRVLRHRKRGDRQDAGKHDDDGDHPGEDRPIDEKARHVLILLRDDA